MYMFLDLNVDFQIVDILFFVFFLKVNYVCINIEYMQVCIYLFCCSIVSN